RELRDEMRPLGHLPARCVWDPARPRQHIRHGTAEVVAVAGDVGKGRILFLADHSVFVNGMMAPRDDNNVEFTQDALAWLADGQRTRVLFVEDGKVRTDFKVQLAGPSGAAGAPRINPEDALDLMTEEQLVGTADATLAQWEAEDGPNATLWDW